MVMVMGMRLIVKVGNIFGSAFKLPNAVVFVVSPEGWFLHIISACYS